MRNPAERDHRTHGRCDDIQGLTFEKIAQAMNKDEVWVAALFYGQVSSTLVRGRACVEYTSR
jgi:cyanate lyase